MPLVAKVASVEHSFARGHDKHRTGLIGQTWDGPAVGLVRWYVFRALLERKSVPPSMVLFFVSVSVRINWPTNKH